ncbi:hypothetical protein ACFORL_11220 [Legionella dresdenensis]|uniref:Alpha/beta hydrolase n=1 Tax=Legionella dresdenensis TaxID=450200 RepID=A0ABV8CH41_9GAMM
MDLPRFIICLLFLLLSMYAYSEPNNLGIAFVHGTNDHRTDAEGNYWKKDFIEEMSHYLLNEQNYIVVACDYGQNLWHEDAAGCTVDQLLSFITDKKIDKLIVYSHSNGGNIMRWILSNPTYDPRYYELSQKIKQVIALSPSSGGTPLADEVNDGNIFGESVGWLLGYRNDSVRQQRIGDMALLNGELLFGTPDRISLPVPFRVVVSTDVTASPFTPASYCNGYLLNIGLKMTQWYLKPCSDGFLECSSQTTAGETWFYDIQKTTGKTTFSHSQSRHTCFGLEKILGRDLVAQGVH